MRILASATYGQTTLMTTSSYLEPVVQKHVIETAITSFYNLGVDLEDSAGAGFGTYNGQA